MTEATMIDGWKELFGAPCDVIAKTLYMKASHNIDFSRIKFIEFYNLLIPLMVRQTPLTWITSHGIGPEQNDKRQESVLLVGPSGDGLD